MIITKEQQEAWVDAYVKEKHNTDECIGFIDGINKALEAVKNNIFLPDKNIYSDYHKKFLKQIKDKSDGIVEKKINVIITG